MTMSPWFNMFRATNILIMRYGKNAPIRAGKQTEERYRKRDLTGCVDWLRTPTAMHELLTRELRDNPVVH